MMTSNPRPRLSIVIPAYNERELLPAAMAALRESLEASGWLEESEIVVCDNASTDGTASIAEAHGARVVDEARRNIAAARNAGGRAALGEWLIFTDADSCVSPGLIRDTLAALHDDSIIAGGSLLTFDQPHSRGRRIMAFWNWLSVRKTWAAGGYIFCRKTDFEAIGGFDDRYYASEELDFTERMKALGKRSCRRFVILTAHPLTTSARKLSYRVSWRELVKVVQFALGRRSIAKDRANCAFWYDVER